MIQKFFFYFLYKQLISKIDFMQKTKFSFFHDMRWHGIPDIGRECGTSN